jgi:hypothetical protein
MYGSRTDVIHHGHMDPKSQNLLAASAAFDCDEDAKGLSENLRYSISYPVARFLKTQHHRA